MNASPSTPWQPTTFLRFEEGRGSSMDTARIITDVGPAFIKAMGNRQGPHALACEYVGTQLAQWFGLPTFDFAILTVDATVDEIPFLRGGRAASGPAFVTRATAGHNWGGSEDELKRLVNPEAISRLIVFDTWTRNCDRHPPDLSVRHANYDNVFSEDVGPRESDQCRLVAMDHGHCFTSAEELNGRVARIDFVKDPGLYGLFPGFVSRVREDDVKSARRITKTAPGTRDFGGRVGPAAMGGPPGGEGGLERLDLPKGGLRGRYDPGEDRTRLLARAVLRQSQITEG